MAKFIEIPDCSYPNAATLVKPSSPTPNHVLHLSNLDCLPIYRNRPRLIYLFRKSTCTELLKFSLSKLLVDYYPLAGRVRSNKDGKILIDCNGEGAVFAEGFMDFSAEEFLKISRWPSDSWKKLLYPGDHWSFFDYPILSVYVINLNCGGMILVISHNHSVVDGVGISQIFNAWAEITRNPNSIMSVTPYHSRHFLKPRVPPYPNPKFSYPEYSFPSSSGLTQPTDTFVPISVTFSPSHINYLKKKWAPSSKCTSFEVLASHMWRTLIKTLDLPNSLNVKLIFGVNIRKKLIPNFPNGYYGNGIILTCAESVVNKLITSHPSYCVELLQKAKEKLNDEYIRSVIDLMEVKKVDTDLSATLVISDWGKLGFEDMDFGDGKPIFMGHFYGSFSGILLPVIGDKHASTMLISVPERVANKFEFYLRDAVEENGLKENNRLLGRFPVPSKI